MNQRFYFCMYCDLFNFGKDLRHHLALEIFLKKGFSTRCSFKIPQIRNSLVLMSLLCWIRSPQYDFLSLNRSSFCFLES
jgi:hypothetical protein